KSHASPDKLFMIDQEQKGISAETGKARYEDRGVESMWILKQRILTSVGGKGSSKMKKSRETLRCFVWV
ncbi:S-Arrestin, partial [Manis pentadactyla]